MVRGVPIRKIHVPGLLGTNRKSGIARRGFGAFQACQARCLSHNCNMPIQWLKNHRVNFAPLPQPAGRIDENPSPAWQEFPRAECGLRIGKLVGSFGQFRHCAEQDDKESLNGECHRKFSSTRLVSPAWFMPNDEAGHYVPADLTVSCFFQPIVMRWALCRTRKSEAQIVKLRESSETIRLSSLPAAAGMARWRPVG